MRKGLVLIAMASLLALAACEKTPAPAGGEKKAADKGATVEKAAPADKAAAAKKAAPVASGEKPKLELFVMSQCPYGVKVMNTMTEVSKEIGGDVDIAFEFIGDDLGGGKFKSMHGESEVQGDILEVCAARLFPENYKYLDFYTCINKNYRKLPEGWEACATSSGVDVAKLKACYEGADGKKFLAESIKKAKALRATGSPTIFLDGKRYSGGRTTPDFVRAICDATKGAKPEACKNLPEPLKFTMTILSDKRCTECEARVKRMEGQLTSMFPGMTMAKLDYKDAKGAALYTSSKLKNLPAFLFEKTVEKDPGYARLKRWMTPQGDFLNLNVGAKFDPTAEICTNKVDDTGNGKIDCADATCANTLECRKEEANKLELFIMSGCPFGVKALDAMKEVLEAFKDDKLNFVVHYIATENPDGTFKALHGQWEVDENIRELCAFKHGGIQKGMEYAWCRNPKIRDASAWKDCVTKAKIDMKKMEACATGPEGKKIHSTDIKIGNAMGISASPTWLANNKFKFSGVDAERIKTNICQHNKGLKGCAKTLSSDAKVEGSCGG